MIPSPRCVPYEDPRLAVSVSIGATLQALKGYIRSSDLCVLPVLTCGTLPLQVIFNSLFNEAVSGDKAGTVSVWHVPTGKLRFRFYNAHKGQEITAMNFDTLHRRLITGLMAHVWGLNMNIKIKTYWFRYIFPYMAGGSSQVCWRVWGGWGNINIEILTRFPIRYVWFTLYRCFGHPG